jgi:hypothetical protein
MNYNFQHIAPTDLRDFVKSLGWQQVLEAVQDNLFVLVNPNFTRRQLVFPIDSDSPDYADAVELTLRKLSDMQNTPLSAIISLLREVKDDTLRFKVMDSRHEDSYIPLSYAVSAINGTKELFLSAACTALRPQLHHPRLSRVEAQELVEKSHFRHTEKGSFVLKVSSPVNAMEVQGNMFDEDIPFVRQTTLVIYKALHKLITAIQRDTLQQLIDGMKQNPTQEISSNLCKAITSFQEEHDDFDLQIDFSWAAAIPIPTHYNIRNSVRIQKDYFSRIDEVRRELRTTSEQMEDTFIATVERLDGDLGEDGRRSGEVIFNLYKGDEIIRAKANLNTTQYGQADIAHMTADAYIKMKGRLHSGNQPRSLTNISLFELLLP